jgi:diketogulonate reductase-like aldo/keto reductase
MKNFRLINGTEIPAIGLGTWQTPDGETAVKAVSHAIKCGYRHVDAAAVYDNEKSVGEGIRKGLQEAGLKREELFVTSKVWNTERGYDRTMRAFEKTVGDLGLNYLDLYLIHWPANAKQFADWQKLNAETWRAMEELYKAGRIRSIGVSNFYAHHLEALMQGAEVMPMVNQIEFHPGFMQKEVVDFCHQHDILVEAWSPLGTGKMLSNETLLSVADKYGCSVAQLCVRWVLQNGVLPLPKSITPSRIEENLDVDGFTISDADMATINAMEYCGGSGLNADEVDF